MRIEKSAMIELVYEHYRNFFYVQIENQITTTATHNYSNDIKLTKGNKATAISCEWQALRSSIIHYVIHVRIANGKKERRTKNNQTTTNKIGKQNYNEMNDEDPP